MTERSRRSVQRRQHELVIGPSALQWDGQSLRLDLEEVGMPLPWRVRGQVRVWPQALSRFATPLDVDGRHHWGPIAPCARIEVDLQQPSLRWQGHAYLDSNEGDEPIARPFRCWDWSRAALRDGSTAVIYDVRNKTGPDRVIAQRFKPDGSNEPFEAPPRQVLRKSNWGISRTMRSAADAAPAEIEQTLEDTPFYARSVLGSSMLGERVQSVHETLDVPRLVARSTRFMLPWRMPRVR
ncbi:MAG: carotenoid 1,2-hydratase [Rubrivivax sp.]|nr:carotenoid 1,2-hydratase [Rubrivivax sp.]